MDEMRENGVPSASRSRLDPIDENSPSPSPSPNAAMPRPSAQPPDSVQAEHAHVLDQFSLALHEEYLQELGHTSKWPLNGIVFGRTQLCVVCMPVSANGRVRGVHFIYDNSCPTSFISEAALHALGMTERNLSYMPTHLNGVAVELVVSYESRKVGLNILGQDFMMASQAKVSNDFAERTWSIST